MVERLHLEKDFTQTFNFEIDKLAKYGGSKGIYISEALLRQLHFILEIWAISKSSQIYITILRFTVDLTLGKALN